MTLCGGISGGRFSNLLHECTNGILIVEAALPPAICSPCAGASALDFPWYRLGRLSKDVWSKIVRG